MEDAFISFLGSFIAFVFIFLIVSIFKYIKKYINNKSKKFTEVENIGTEIDGFTDEEKNEISFIPVNNNKENRNKIFIVPLFIIVCIISIISICNKCIKDENNSRLEKYIEKKETQNYMINALTNKYKEINKMLPVKVDEITTLRAILFDNPVTTMKYEIPDSINEYLEVEDWNEFKEEIKRVNIKNIANSMKNVSNAKFFLKELGLKYNLMYFTESGKLITTILIENEDIISEFDKK